MVMRGSSSTASARILLTYGAYRHDDPWAWEARPRRRPPPACNRGFGDGERRPPSSTSGGIYERLIDDGGPGSGPHGFRSELMNFFIIEN
jgi:hypothetical protein